MGYVERMILGNGTGSKYWERILREIAPIQVVEEQGTTLRARSRYWELWPPGPLLSLLPRGLRPHDLFNEIDSK